MKKKSNPKTAISLILYLSRVGEKLFVAVDGNTIDLADFGIDPQKLHDIGIGIDKVFQNHIGDKNG